MKNKEIKFYIEQAIRKLPTNDANGVKYCLKKAITLLNQSETQEIVPVAKKINEQYDFQTINNTTNAKKVMVGLDCMIEQEKNKLEEILNRKKKKDDENVEQIFG
jgi:hypothetical protein